MDCFGLENVVNKRKLEELSEDELNALAQILGVKKETDYPLFYGIEGVRIKHPGNNVESSKILYKGHEFFADDVVDTMWENWIRDDDWNVIPEREKDEDGFEQYMKDNAYEVIALCETIIGD